MLYYKVGPLSWDRAKILPANSIGKVIGFPVVSIMEMSAPSSWPCGCQEVEWAICWAGVVHSRHQVVKELAAVPMASWLGHGSVVPEPLAFWALTRFTWLLSSAGDFRPFFWILNPESTSSARFCWPINTLKQIPSALFSENELSPQHLNTLVYLTAVSSAPFPSSLPPTSSLLPIPTPAREVENLSSLFCSWFYVGHVVCEEGSIWDSFCPN